MRGKFHLYTQLDAMDCGSSCLRMIAKYYGKNYSLQTNYGRLLPVSCELKGTADIILADRNVLERLLAPLRKVVEHGK